MNETFCIVFLILMFISGYLKILNLEILFGFLTIMEMIIIHDEK